MKGKKFLQNVTGNTLGVLSLIGMVTPLYGAGFQLAERSVKGLGRAYAGEAAIADDASVIASNPAGMTKLSGTQVTTGMFYIAPDISVNATNNVTRAQASTNNAAPDAFIPTVFVSHQVDDRLSVGLGIFSAYGLQTDYSGDMLSVIGTDRSEILTVSVNPSLAFKLSDKVSFGAGLNVTYVKGELTAASTYAPHPLDSDSAIPTPSFRLQGDDVVLGYHIGLLYEPIEGTRIGLSYRSALDVTIEGDAQVGAELDTVTGGQIAYAGDYDATLQTTLPEIVELSVYHELTDRLALHGDVSWTQWSHFKEIAPELGGAAVEQALYTPSNWNDSFRLSVGATYQASDKLTVRAGFAWDQSPVEDEYRTYRIPDAERYWLSCGATYAVNDNLVVDAGYTHVLAEGTTINSAHEKATATSSGAVNIFGLGATYLF